MPPAGNNFTAISAGYRHSLALQRVCQYTLAGDLNDDCEVDFDDLAAMAGKWLVDVDFSHFADMAENWLIDCYVEPTDPACVPK